MLGISQTSDSMMFGLLVILLGACMAATLYDPCFALMMQKLKSDGANAVASVTLIAGFATLLTFPLVFGLSSAMTWQQVTLVFAALATVGVLLLPREAESAAATSRHGPKLPIEKGPLLIAFSFGLVMMGHAILLFLLPVALVHSQSDANISFLALAILGPAQIAGRIAWKRYGAALTLQNCTIVVFACLCLPASLLLIFGAAPLSIYLALTIQGACYGVHTILRPALAQRYLPPSQLGRGFGAIATVGLLMMALGPATGGFFWTATGMSGLLGAILALNAAALVLGLLLRKTDPKGEMA
jgi:predicted MFS family arabinose efflux permease